MDGHVDVLVIGAGPAGAAAAWSAAVGGARRVVLVERCDWPRHKVCGSCVNPAGVAVLTRMGALSAEMAAIPLSRLRLCTAAASFGLSLDAGIAIERAVLDSAVVGAAERAGAAFRARSSARVLGRDGTRWRVRCGEREITAGVVIACDGLAGTSLAAISDAEGLGTRIDPTSWMGGGAVIPRERAERWHGTVGPSEVAMHIADEGYVGLVRLADGRVDLAGAVDAAYVKSCGGPAGAIGAILSACGVRDAPARLADEPVAGVGLLTRCRARPAARGLIIAGDAAGYVEPFTGEGIAWALVQGEHAGVLAARAAVDSAACSSLEHDWPRWLRAAIDPRRRTCRALRWTLRRPPARRVVTAALGRSSLARTAAAALVRRTWRPYPEASACAS